MLTLDKPLVRGNDLHIFVDDDNRTYAFWNGGYIFACEIDLEKGTLTGIRKNCLRNLRRKRHGIISELKVLMSGNTTNAITSSILLGHADMRLGTQQRIPCSVPGQKIRGIRYMGM